MAREIAGKEKPFYVQQTTAFYTSPAGVAANSLESKMRIKEKGRRAVQLTDENIKDFLGKRIKCTL